MADKKPIKATYSGTDTNGLAEFVAADTIGVADGGTGLTTVATSNILTGNGTSALSAEANLTFDGTNLTMGTGNLIVGTSGKGIDFSATSDGSGTAASELLDDYEEGTFTPVLKYATTAYSLGGVSRGTYTKIGKLVWFNASINCLNPSASNDTSSVTMEGLPYAVGSAADYTTHSGRMTYFIESNAWFTPYTIPSSSKIQFFYSSNSAAWGTVKSRDIYNASYANDMVITGAYMIA